MTKKNYNSNVSKIILFGFFSSLVGYDTSINELPNVPIQKPNHDTEKNYRMCYMCNKKFPPDYFGVHLKIGMIRTLNNL